MERTLDEVEHFECCHSNYDIEKAILKTKIKSPKDRGLLKDLTLGDIVNDIEDFLENNVDVSKIPYNIKDIKISLLYDNNMIQNYKYDIIELYLECGYSKVNFDVLPDGSSMVILTFK